MSSQQPTAARRGARPERPDSRPQMPVTRDVHGQSGRVVGRPEGGYIGQKTTEMMRGRQSSQGMMGVRGRQPGSAISRPAPGNITPKEEQAKSPINGSGKKPAAQNQQNSELDMKSYLKKRDNFIGKVDELLEDEEEAIGTLDKLSIYQDAFRNLYVTQWKAS